MIIIGENKNNYFYYLMDTFTKFKRTGDNKFVEKADITFSIIKSGSYHEMNELSAESYRNEIVSTLIKNYNPDKEIAYHYFKL